MAIWILLSGLVLLGIISWLISKYASKKGSSSYIETEQNPDEEDAACCGQHLVCEQDSLLYQGEKIVYYDDEELDAFKDIAAEAYPKSALRCFEEVFYSMQTEDIAGWLRSLQLRNINLPLELRDEALMIVSERRQSIQ